MDGLGVKSRGSCDGLCGNRITGESWGSGRREEQQLHAGFSSPLLAMTLEGGVGVAMTTVLLLQERTGQWEGNLCNYEI